uniref:General transcription and DNA repair factor IIH subunit TFB5 n=1 Tax=Monodon monoceros TaxID=40151 RepID=A0A8C6BFS0_MONMO
RNRRKRTLSATLKCCCICGRRFVALALGARAERGVPGRSRGLKEKEEEGESPRSLSFSDPAMKQFLLYLDESNALGKKFIIQDIDDTHIFVIAELVNVLQERVGELMDQNAFSLTQK